MMAPCKITRLYYFSRLSPNRQGKAEIKLGDGVVKIFNFLLSRTCALRVNDVQSSAKIIGR
jgi:hypothetical protein